MPSLVPKALGWLLVIGSVTFWIGAVTPPYRQWMGVPIEEYLAIVGANARNWHVMHAFFALGMLLTLVGLAGLAGHLKSSATASVWAYPAVVLFSISSLLWLLQVGFRVSVTPWAAAELTAHGVVPTHYRALHRWMGVLFGMQMLVGYLAEVAYGGALLSTSVLPRWVGWTALTFGLLAVPGLATPVFQPPLMLEVVPFVVGVAILRQ